MPPNNDPTVARGEFWLADDVLSFRVDVPAITFTAERGTINGPAQPGENAPMLFDLGGNVFHPGSSLGDPPGYIFSSPFDGTFGAGPFTLTGEQIGQLQSGLWYVNIYSTQHPEKVQLRGQILPVPEPSIGPLLMLGSCLVAYLKRKKPMGYTFIRTNRK